MFCCACSWLKASMTLPLALSARLLKAAEATHQLGQIIEILVLQALAFQGKKELDQALAALERALALAQPEGYVRTFLDEGEPMAKLLYQAKVHRSGSGYAAELAVCDGPGCQQLGLPLNS